MATIEDVARTAGVSASTISRVFNRPDIVRDGTRARVLEAAEQLGFVPNGLARALATGKSGLIGLVVPDITNPFFAYLARGCEDELRRHSLTVALCNSEERGAEEVRIRQLLEARRVEGFIYASAPAIRLQLRHSDEAATRPTVFVERRPDGPRVDAVYLDDASGARQAADYLVRLGHRRIAVLAGLPETLPGQVRLQAFRGALAGHGIDLPRRYALAGDFKYPSGRAAADRLLRLHPRPTAVFAASDPMAYGLIGRLHELGARVPEDLSVVGYDDLPMSQVVFPPLTSIRSPMYELGREAARLLVDRLAQPDLLSRERTLPVALVERRSCAPPPEGAMGGEPASPEPSGG